MSDSSLPAAVHALIERSLGPITNVAPTIGGFSNLSRRARIDGRPCVIKAAALPVKRANLRHEAAALTLLAPLAVPAPPLLALVEDADWTVLVSAELPGRPGVTLLESSQDELPAAFAALGTILSGLHNHSPRPPGGRGEGEWLALPPRLAAARAALDGPDLDDQLRERLRAALAHPAWHAGQARLLHGDAGMHNVMWDADAARCAPTAYLLDWEWAAAGPPAFDLAWLRWTMRWRGLPEELWRIALAAYGRPAPEPDLLDALALGQIAMILARSTGQPAAYAEWLRRARWTLGVL